MSYLIRNRSRVGGIVPEEAVLLDALAAFRSDPDEGDPRDFMPLSTLYDAYWKYMTSFDLNQPEAPALLTPAQFGVAVRRVLAIDPRQMIFHRLKGKQVRGFTHFRGPGVIHRQDGPGRPSDQKRQTV
jgi:hypothetical protein